jgi:uncharacterized membrane protein
MEMPIMLVVTIVAARWVIRRLDVSPAIRSRLVMGGTALGLLLLAEFGLVLRVRGLTWAEYFASRDPVSGTAYYLMLGVVALLPLLLAYTEKPVHGDEG